MFWVLTRLFKGGAGELQMQGDNMGNVNDVEYAQPEADMGYEEFGAGEQAQRSPQQY